MMNSTRSIPAHRTSPTSSVLIADDSQVLRVAVRRLLQNMGHSVDVVSDGPEAIEAVFVRTYDVLILDVQMPELGGTEVARRIREAESGWRHWIIGISGDDSAQQDCIDAGMDAFLAKPLLARDLIRLFGQRDAWCRENAASTRGLPVPVTSD